MLRSPNCLNLWQQLAGKAERLPKFSVGRSYEVSQLLTLVAKIEPVLNSCVERQNSLRRGTMLKKLIGLAVATIWLTLELFISSANAVQIDESVRTVPINEQGETAVLSLQQVKEGKRLFNYACAQCHAGGVTKTNQNVGLDPEALANATPPRDNIAGLVDYIQNPTTYDGEEEISEYHPSIKSADIYAAMRNLTEDDLVAIAGHVLIQPKIIGDRWGAGKTKY